MNVWTIIGRLGKDAETRSTNSGDKITSFSVAVDQGYGDKKTTMWVNCSMWGDRGSKVAGYIKKGDMIGVTGEAQLRTWTDNQGVLKPSLECRVTDVQLLGQKRDAAAAQSGGGYDGGYGSAADQSEEIPFAVYDLSDTIPNHKRVRGA